MHEEEILDHNDARLQNKICYTCLSGTRKIVSLGEYAGIFNRIIHFSAEDVQRINICWECLAVLKKVKTFETKCYISQKILSTKWENRRPPRCLSTLVTTPVKIDIHLDDDSNKKIFGFTFEEKPPVCSQTKNSGTIETYINCALSNSNQKYYCIKEENCSIEDQTDLRSDNEGYDDLKEEKVDSNFFDKKESNEIKKSQVNTIEVNKNGMFIKADKEEINRIEVTKEFNNGSNSTDLSEELDSYINNATSKLKVRRKNNESDRRKGLRKKDLEEHFRIVGYDSNDRKRLRIKLKMDSSELEFWREMERKLEFYVDQPYKCKNCIRGFSSLKKKFEHDKKYHDTSTAGYTCDICSSQLHTKDDLSTHVSKHYERLACTLCQFRCLSRQAMRCHMTRHRRLVVCAHCDTSFSNVGLFYKHFKANHAVFICDHCGKKCRTKYTLEKHMRHHSEKNICLICNKVYASRNSLRNHSEMKHKVTSDEMAYCVKCDKQFANVPLYRRHVQTSKAHAAERDADRNKKQVNCPVCGNVYSRKTYMMNHYRHVHMNQSKHYCVDCDKHFLNRTRYVDHRKYQHEGETKAKNKMCNICGRGFAANRTLLNHIRTHSGERPYECEYCDAKFTQKHGMLSHIKYIHMKSKRRGFQ